MNPVQWSQEKSCDIPVKNLYHIYTFFKSKSMIKMKAYGILGVLGNKPMTKDQKTQDIGQDI